MSVSDEVTIWPVGGRFIIGVPARQATVAVEEADRLVATGAFTREAPADEGRAPRARKAARRKASTEG